MRFLTGVLFLLRSGDYFFAVVMGNFFSQVLSQSLFWTENHTQKIGSLPEDA